MTTQQEIHNINNFLREPKVRELVKAHSKISTPRQLFSLAFDWAVMIGTILFCERYFNPLTYMAAVLVIAARQSALMLIMHEATHLRISKTLWLNDLISDLFCAYPAGISTEGYRKNHSAHHGALNTDKDPDWARKAHLEEWHFPKTRWQMTKILLKQFVVGGYQLLTLMWMLSKNDKKKLIYLAVAATAITVAGIWPQVLLYWFVPLFTAFPVIQRIRSIAEHLGMPWEHDMNSSRNIKASPMEKFFLCPHNVHWHLVHHLFPHIPQHNLKSLHNELMKLDLYHRLSYNNDSYIGVGHSVFQDVTTPRRAQSETAPSLAA
ncbi:MAG: fatty acid desaturase family protein [Bdellovibrio sp.]